MGPGLKLIYPPVSDYYSQAQVDSKLDTLSSNLIVYIDQQDTEEYNRLLTTSGDLVSWILSKNYATEIQLTTASGDIIAQIPTDYVTLQQLLTTSGDLVLQIPSLTGYATQSWVNMNFIDSLEMATISGDIVAQVASGTGPGSSVILEGLCGLVTTQVGDTWYIDPCNMLIPATVSGVTISGTGGMICTFYPDPVNSGTGYWLIDGSNFSAGITLEYTTVYGTAGSGNGIYWGNAMFTGSGGTAIYHELGNADHSTLITPCDDISFDIDKSAMLGEVYVQKGVDYDIVYTTGSGSYGQNFSWMVIQGWPWNPNVPQGHLLEYLEVTATTSGAIFGQGQDTGIEVTVSGGSWLLTYNVYYQMNSENPGVSWGYAWLEDSWRVIPGSHIRLAAASPTQSGVDVHSSNISFVSPERGRTYKLVMSKDVDTPADQMLLLGGSGDKNSRSSLLPIPVSHMGIGAGQQYGGSLVTLDGHDGVKAQWDDIGGVWDVEVYPPTLPFHGSGGIELTAVSEGLWIDGSNVIGDGGIRYMVGSGTGISWGENTFSGMTGCIIQHDLGTHLHSTQITAGGDDAPTATGIAAIGGIYVTKGTNTDVVYNTGDAGQPFTWVSARGFPVYTAVEDHTGELFTITGSVSTPSYGAGQDISMQITVPPGTWNLLYSLAYNLADGEAGLDRGFVWLEDNEGILNGSTSVLTAWNPMQSYSVQYASQILQVAPLTSQTYTMKAAIDSNYPAEQFVLYGNSTTSGSICTLVAIPADANGFFGHDGPSGGGGDFLIIGTNGIDTSYDIDGNWTVDGGNMHEHLKVEGRYGIQTYVADGKLCIDGSNFGTGSTLVSGIEIPHGEQDHSATMLEVTNTSFGPQFGQGIDTGVDVTVSGGNWNLVYTIAYQIQADIFGTNDCFVWLEDDYEIVPNSTTRLRSMSPAMNYMINNVSNVTNVTPLYAKTYHLRASKYPQDYSNNFYLHGGTTSSGAQCNLVALPAVYGLGDSSSLVQVSGTNHINVSYENGVWIIDGAYLNDLRSGWDSSGEGVYSTAKQSSLDSIVSITSTAALPSAGSGQNTGLYVTVGSGSWNISYSLSYEFVKDTGYVGGLIWLQDDFDTVVSGSSKFIGEFAPIASFGKKNIQHVFTVTTDSVRQYTLYAAKHNEYTPSYFYMHGGTTSSGATSTLMAWSPEVYATNIDMSTVNVTHEHYTTNNYNSSYYSVDSVPGMSSDGQDVTVSGNLAVNKSITATGIKLTNDNYILNSFSRLIKNTVGGALALDGSTHLIWTPRQSNLIGLHNGTSWVMVQPASTPLAFNNAAVLGGGTLASGFNYDVFANYVSPEEFTLEFNKWATDTTRVTAPQRFEGILVFDTTTSGIKKRYLGTVRPYYNGVDVVFVDTKEKRLLMNYYNKTKKPFGKSCPYSSNTFIASSTTGLRRWNNNADYLIEVITDGLNAFELACSLYQENGSYGHVCFSLDSQNSIAPECGRPRSNMAGTRTCVWSYTASEGYHFIYPLSITGGNNEYYYYWNDASGRDAIISQVDGWIWS